MRIVIQVKPNSKKPGIEKKENGEYIVRVNAPPVDGKANLAVIEMLSDFFDVPKSHVQILQGTSSKKKRVEIIERNPL